MVKLVLRTPRWHREPDPQALARSRAHTRAREAASHDTVGDPSTSTTRKTTKQIERRDSACAPDPAPQ
jgi:hypothetical protein